MAEMENPATVATGGASENDLLASAVNSENSHSRSRKQQRPEQAVQFAVVEHLRRRGVPGLVFVHCPNGGYRTPIEAAIFKAMGTRAGVSDILLWHGGKSYALELKVEGGRATAEQKQFLSDMDKAGALTALATGLNAAIRTLEDWHLLRGVMS